MQHIINYIKVLIIPLLVIILVPFLLAILNLIGMKSYGWILLVIMMITSIITGFKIGRKTNKKGYLQGLLIGFILVLLMLVIGIFSKNPLNLHTLLYYLIIVVSCAVGSMLGIQKKVSD